MLHALLRAQLITISPDRFCRNSRTKQVLPLVWPDHLPTLTCALPLWRFCPCFAPLLPFNYSNLSPISLSCLLPHYYSLHQTWVTSYVPLEGFVG